MSDKTKSEPKMRARLVRQSLEAARVLAMLENELVGSGDDLTQLWSRVREARESIMFACMRCEGVRIAVFPVEEQEGGAK